MSKTNENLKVALAGESQANRQYLAFAKKAEEENLPGVAKLFRAAAESETVHALKYLKMLGEINSTKENLEAAKGGETEEAEKMYPQFVAEAEAENETVAKNSFAWAGKVEGLHAGMYGEALDKVSSGEDITEKEYYICQGCGYTTPDEAPEVCPVCGAPKSMFKKVE